MERLKKIVERDWFNYVAVLVTATFFGFFRLDYQSIWNDESISIHFAKWSLAVIWDYVPKHDLHPPLYYTIIHYWQIFFGGSINSYRGFSALCFVVSAVLMYHLALLIFKRKPVALAVAMIFATNPFAVLYAQEVRSYAFLIMLTIINGIFFYNVNYEAKTGCKLYVGYALSALLLIYTNILSLFILAAHFFMLIILRNWQRAKGFVVIYAGLFLAFLPVLKALKNANDYDYSYYNPERFGVFMKTVVVFSGFIGARVNILNGKFHHYGLLGLSLVFYGLLLSLLIVYRKKVNSYLALFFILCFVFLMTAAHIKFPVPDPKYFYPIFPFFILLLGVILDQQKKRCFFWLILSGVMLFNLVFLYNYYFVKAYEKENWKQIILDVEKDYSLEKNKSAVSISPVSEQHTTWEYYSDGTIKEYGGTMYGNSTSSVDRAMTEILKPKPDIVYISRFIYNLFDPNDHVRQYLETHNYKKTREFSNTKVDYWRYDLERVKLKVQNSKAKPGIKK